MRKVSILLLALLLSLACASSREGGAYQSGIASWYGKAFQGLPTASGEIYDMYKMTAAHKTLPLGTVVKVVCQETGKSVVVRINDRGPFIRGRIIDLSYVAAKKIGIDIKGITPVTLYLMDKSQAPPPPAPAEGSNLTAPPARDLELIVQVGAFKSRENAIGLKERLEAIVSPVFLEQFEGYTRVLIGPFDSEEKARVAADILEREGYTAIIRNH